MVGMADAERSEVDVDAGALRPGADATIDRSAMLYLAIRDRQVFPTARKLAKAKTPTLSVPLAPLLLWSEGGKGERMHVPR